MPKLALPTPLRPYADKKAEHELEGATVGELLQQLVTKYPALSKHLFGDDGALRGFVNVYVNDEDIRHLEKLATPVKPTDLVSIIPSIAGGASDARGLGGLGRDR